MRQPILLLALAFLCAATAAPAQPAQLGSSCIAAQYGPQGMKEFLAFDADLRVALNKQDAVAMAFLVKFPLRVNEPRGGIYSIENAQALRRHFEQIFPPAVRSAVLNQPLASLFCRSEMGIMYGSGQVWASQQKFGWAIETVNIPAPPQPGKAAPFEIKFLCRAGRHRILIDQGPAGAFRYRSWDRPGSLLVPPSLVIPGGKGTFEGTGVCSHPVWTFENGTATYSVYGALGCTENTPPENARGILIVTIPGQKDTRLWCY